jgi:hypothetical protein
MLVDEAAGYPTAFLLAFDEVAGATVKRIASSRNAGRKSSAISFGT